MVDVGYDKHYRVKPGQDLFLIMPPRLHIPAITGLSSKLIISMPSRKSYLILPNPINTLGGGKLSRMMTGRFQVIRISDKSFYFAPKSTRILRLLKKIYDGKDTVSVVHLESSTDCPAEMKIGLSYVSVDNAKRNLQKKLGKHSFEEVKEDTSQTWKRLPESGCNK